MDALVDGLLEELNCDVVFKIPIFGGIPIYESVVVTWIIMAAVFLQCHLDKDCFIVRNSYTADKHFVYLLYFYLITLLT